jgi:hypothetical protein
LEQSASALKQTARDSFLSSRQRTTAPALAALSPRIVERILSSQKPDGASVAAFLKFVADRDAERAEECLSAVSAKLGELSEPALAQLKTDLNPLMQNLLARDAGTPLSLSAQLLAARLGFVEVDPATIRTRHFHGTNQATRLQALMRSSRSVTQRCSPRCQKCFLPAHHNSSAAFTALTCRRLKLADVLLDEYPKLASELQPLAIDLIMQREPWARKLLDAVLANKLPKACSREPSAKDSESNDREALWAVESVRQDSRGAEP